MRTVVLGAGRMGRRHIQVVKEIGLHLVGIADSNTDALIAAQREQAVAPEWHFRDAADLIKQTKPEVVVIATTAPTHADLTCLAAESGARYILCEKPMATSLADCDRMIATCARHGTKLAVNHQIRFMEQYVVPKQLIQSEKFGGLTSVTVVAGNFGLAMNGTHYFEMFRYLTDEVPTEVVAWFSAEKVPNPRGAQFSDSAGCVRLVTAKGRRFYMEVGADQGHGITEVYGARYGQIVADQLSGRFTHTVRQEEFRSLPTTRYGSPSEETLIKVKPDDLVTTTRAVMEALLSGGQPPNGEDGRLTIKVLLAAHLSHESGGRPVQLSATELHKDRVFPWA